MSAGPPAAPSATERASDVALPVPISSAAICQRPHGHGGGCGPIFDAELHKHLFQMLVHGAWTDGQYFADVAIGLAATQPQQHLRLA